MEFFKKYIIKLSKGIEILFLLFNFFAYPGSHKLINLLFKTRFNIFFCNLILLIILLAFPLAMTIFLYYGFSRFVNCQCNLIYKHQINANLLIIIFSTIEYFLNLSCLHEDENILSHKYFHDFQIHSGFIFYNIYLSNELIFNLFFVGILGGYLIFQDFMRSIELMRFISFIRKKFFYIVLFGLYVVFYIYYTSKFIIYVDEFENLTEQYLSSLNMAIRVFIILITVLYLLDRSQAIIL